MMKNADVFVLAVKNLKRNFGRSLLTLITITLLAITVMTIANFVYYLKVNIDGNLLKELNEKGVDLELTAVVDYTDKTLDSVVLNEFISYGRELNIAKEYYIGLSPNDVITNNNSRYNLFPCISGMKNYNANPPIVAGENWDSEGNIRNYIWINNEFSNDNNIQLGDKVWLSIEGGSQEFIVRGIVDSQLNYIDYSYFNIGRIRLYNIIDKHENIKIISKIHSKISQFNAMESKSPTGGVSHSMNSGIAGSYRQYNVMFAITLALAVLLIILSLLIGMGCLVNSLHISVEDNGRTIGIMKALGARNKKINKYVLYQGITVTVIATGIAAAIVALLEALTLKAQLNSIMQVLFNTVQDKITIGFNFLMPIISLIVLIVTVIIAVSLMMREYGKNSVVDVMRGAE